MTDLTIQASFNAGEWSTKLYARVDLAKYKSGAALLNNFFVDYRGGASTRPGTKYILQCRNSASAVRLIGFQASFSVGYVLEFGDLYVRFYNNGSPVLESAVAITDVSQANPGVVTITNSYADGDWIYITGVGGMTELNGNYYIVDNRTGTDLTLTDLNGVAIDTTAFTAYTSGGTAQRVYTLTSPYSSSELAALKYTQNVSQMIICHPNHAPYLLTNISAASWTLAAITFGATISAPTGQAVATTLGAGSVNYAYVITAVDSAGQESEPSAFATLASTLDLRTNAGTNTVSWSSVTGAVSYNVYKAEVSYAGAVPAGSMFGFVGVSTSTSFIDSNIGPDFSQTPPVAQNPFFGAGVQSVTVTSKALVSTFPEVVFGASGGGATATGVATVELDGVTVTNGGSGWTGGEGQTITYANGVVLQVSTVTGFGQVATINIVSRGSYIGSAGDPLNTGPFAQTSTTYAGGTGTVMTFTWRLNTVEVTSPGTGYVGAPAVTFINGGASTATATLGAPSAGNPTVPGYFQQRLILAGPVSQPQQFNMSKPGAQFNFDVSQITQPDDAIQASLVSGQLNTIQSMIAQPQGLIMLSDRQAWLVNGGSVGSAVTPINIVANAQSFNGAGGPLPIVATNNIIYVQAKGSIVRDMAFSIYTNVYTGTDISAISSHLFYNFTLSEWAWAEEPFKLLWAIRNDGVVLTLTYLKEQEFIAWTHHDTNGAFKSVATVVESTATAGNIDAIYFVVQREVNGNAVQYVERLAERAFPNGLASAWCVDAGISYTGAATLSFTGAQHLAGMQVVGIATDDDDNTGAIAPLTVGADGSFTLPAPAAPATGYTYVLIGLAFTAQLQTLALDLGDPTLQGKVKKINSADVRVSETLGLSIGSDFNNLVTMKDLIVGNVSSMLVGQASQLVTDLVDGDAHTFLDPTFTVPGQYCIQQSNPFPATVLGVISDYTQGDTGRQRG